MKKGNIVICDSNTNPIVLGNSVYKLPLTPGNKYVIIDIKATINWISVMNDIGIEKFYPIENFKTLSDYRDEQLNKLFTNTNI
jgi:hypothetical protein